NLYLKRIYPRLLITNPLLEQLTFFIFRKDGEFNCRRSTVPFAPRYTNRPRRTQENSQMFFRVFQCILKHLNSLSSSINNGLLSLVVPKCIFDNLYVHPCPPLPDY